MTVTTWESLYGDAQTQLIRKMLFGGILIMDWDPSGDLSAFTAFQSDGTLADLSGTDFVDIGPLTADGVDFNPAVAGSDTMIWKSRQPARHDITSDVETAAFVPNGTSPTTIALYRNLPLTGLDPISGSTSTRIAKPTAGTIYRSLLFLGADGEADQAAYGAILYPKCSVTDKANSTWKTDTEIQRGLTVTPYVDPVCGTDVVEEWDGPGWRALA